MPEGDAGDDAARPFSGPRTRWSEAESRERLFAAAEKMIGRTGLTVGLDHLRFEEVIQHSGVARSAAYRAFPHKEKFYAALLVRLAGPSWAGTAAFDEETIRVATQALAGHLNDMGTPEGRWRAVLDACRIGAEQNFRTLSTSTEWRTYVALNATMISMPEGALRTDLVRALKEAETAFTEKMASFYKQISAVVGIRLRSEYGEDYTVLAAVGAAVIEGLGLRNAISPEVVGLRYQIAAFGDGIVRDWSVPALGFTAILTSMVELDPNWTPDRLAPLRDA